MLEFHGHDHRRALPRNIPVQMPILTGEERCLPFGGNTDDLLPLFPLNILVLLAIILMLAYITRCVGRFFQQTFDNRDGYEWKEILRLR